MTQVETGKAKTPPPISIRLAIEERKALEEAAGRTPLSTFIREQALGAAAVVRRRTSRSPIQDHTALARGLAALGTSELSRYLKEIAEAVRIGALIVTPETERELREACMSIARMRSELLRALGVSDGAAK